MAAPEEEKTEKPAGLQTNQLGGGGTAWALARRFATALRAARCGVHFRAGLEAADGDNLIPRPNPDGEGAGSPPHSGVGAVVGAVERQDDVATTQPDEGGAQQLGRQLDTGIVPGQGKRGASKVFKNILKISSTEKIRWAGQFEYQKLPQLGKDQCIPLAVHGG